MITLILFHLCGIGRLVKSLAWSLLIVGCVYTSSVAVFGSLTHAQSSQTTIIYDSFNALQVLEFHDQYAWLFDGNNTVVFDLLKNTYRQWDNHISYKRFTDAFSAISADQRKRYSIDKEEVVMVLTAIELVLDRNITNQTTTTMSQLKLPYGYTTTIYPKKEWTLVVFETAMKDLPKRMNRYFWDKTQYSCEREQCRRFNHMYSDQEMYEVTLFTTMKSHKHERNTFVLSLWESQTMHSSVDKVKQVTKGDDYNSCNLDSKAYTWIAKWIDEAYQYVWCEYGNNSAICNAYEWDTPISEKLPLFCIHDDVIEKKPDSFVESKSVWWDWTWRKIWVSKSYYWSQITSKEWWDSLCESSLGDWWKRMQHHDWGGRNLWWIWMIEEWTNGRVYIKDQKANPRQC